MSDAGATELRGARERDPFGAPPSLLNTATFWPVWFGILAASKLWFRLRIENQPRLRGGYVIAANHASFLDPLVLGSAAPRRVHFLMTETVWRSPTLGWFYRWSRTIPLAARGGNREALRAARSLLQQGRVLGIFPEGGISRDGRLMLGNPGAVSLVFQENVPIVPAGIVGAHDALPVGGGLPRPRRIAIRFGDPIPHDELTAQCQGDRKTRLAAATRLIMERIAALSGQTTREVQLAAPAENPR